MPILPASQPLLDHLLEARFAAAMPRLARLARLRGIPTDAIDDLVQQTLLEAWHALDTLRDAARFDAWLDGICRNLCRHEQRLLGARSPLPLSRLAARDDASFEPPAEDEAFDLDAVLDREDLARLLDRALGHLPAATRDAVEACYLSDLPAGEAALRLGLSINALEVRLHRARQQLRQVLQGPLREDARALDLAVTGDVAEGWRETHEWCGFCGQRRLRGLLMPEPDGTTSLRLRCPHCSPKYDLDVEYCAGLRELNGLRSFKPALRRYHVMKSAYCRALQASDWRRCPRCGGEIHVHVISPEEYPIASDRWFGMVDCPRCGPFGGSWTRIALWSTHETTADEAQWRAEHPRSRLEPDLLTTYEGQLAVRSRVRDMATGHAVVLFFDTQVPRLLGSYEE